MRRLVKSEPKKRGRIAGKKYEIAKRSLDWVLATRKKKPRAYDLVEVIDRFGTKQYCWWTGTEWDFGKKKILGNVKKWRLLPKGMTFGEIT